MEAEMCESTSILPCKQMTLKDGDELFTILALDVV
jgi:hypothetical protein